MPRLPVFKINEDESGFAWKRLVANSKRTVHAVLQEDPRRYFHVQLSPNSKFPDEVKAQKPPAKVGLGGIALYSRSRYGRFDFGVNRKHAAQRRLVRLQPRAMVHSVFRRQRTRSAKPRFCAVFPNRFLS